MNFWKFRICDIRMFCKCLVIGIISIKKINAYVVSHFESSFIRCEMIIIPLASLGFRAYSFDFIVKNKCVDVICKAYSDVFFILRLA